MKSHRTRRRPFQTDLLEPRRLLASVANVLADINQTSSQLAPRYFEPLGTTGVTLFAGKSAPGDGYELWRTDGTSAGTRRVKDINPGLAESNPSTLTNVNGTVFFVADDGVHGVELWKSDGTEGGTVLVKDIVAGTTGASPASMIAVGSKIFFTAGGGVWSSDGTDAGTVRAGTATYTFNASRPLAALGGSVYFGAIAPANGNGAIFKTDGTNAAPTLVRQFNYSSAPRELAAFNGRIYFNADQDSSTRGDLWATDGTTAGTVMVKAIGSASYSNVSRLTPSGSLLYFFTGDVTTGKYELWRTDGTGANTIPLNTTGVDRYTQVTPFGTNSILVPITTAALGTELYRCDGTATLTLLKDVLPGADSGATNGSAFLSGSTYFFVGYRADGATDLWKTDGTAAGTVRVRDLGGQYFLGGSLGGAKMYFSLGVTFGLGELWTSDGTTAGTVRIDTSNQLGNGSSMWDYWTGNNGGTAFTKYGTSVLFSADDGVNGAEVWITSPQTGITKLLADVNPGIGSSNPTGFTVASDGSVLFSATRPDVGTELFRLLPSGTVQLAADLSPGLDSGSSGDPFRMLALGSSVYYSARIAVGGYFFLHRYDVSTLANVAVRDAANARLLSASGMMTAGTNTYFCAAPETNSSSYGLYVITSPGATPVRLKTLSVDSNIWASYSAAIGSTLYFVATDGTSGYELWKTDGTLPGTSIVKDINPGSGSAGIGEMVTFNNKIYFGASTSDGITTLWSSDGTTAGTSEYATGVTSPTSFSIVQGNLYVAGVAANGINNIFRTDGTGSTTAGSALTPIVANATATRRPITTYGGAGWTLFYVVQDLAVGRTYSLEQYTPASGSGTATTTQVKDLWVYNINDVMMTSTWGMGRLAFLATGNRLYFPAYRPEWGVEPHSYVLDPIATQIGGDVYWDKNRDGVKSAGEAGTSGVTLYVDLDNDGTRDSDEPTTVTDASGNYNFRNLDFGSYVVRAILGAGQSQTQPAANAGAGFTIATNGTTTGSGRVGLVDDVAPAIAGIFFDRDAPRMRVRVVFNDDIDPASLAATDLSLTLQPAGTIVSMASNAVSYDAATRTATFTFPAYTNGMLPDGRYRAKLNIAAATDGFGNANTNAMQVDFGVLAGDTNGDGTVNFSDLLILAQNYGKTGMTAAQGNVDYDASGNVDFADLLLLAQRYGQSLPAAIAMPSVATTTTKKRTVIEI